MKKHIFYILIGMAAMMSMASCVKDTLYLLPEDDPDYFNPNEWKEGTMVVTTDWSRTDLGTIPTNNYFVRLNADTRTVSDATNTFSHMHPEDYKVIAYYDPTGITIADNIATVNNEPDGTLLRMPGMLMVSDYKDAKVMRGDTTHVNLTMRQLVHEVNVTIYMRPGDENVIANITGSIDGIAQAVDITNGIVTSDYNSIITLPLTLKYVDYNGTDESMKGQQVPAYTCTIRIIDIMEDSTQPMELNIVYNDGTEEKQTITLENILNGINKKDEATDVELDITVKNENTSIRSTIIDWHEVDEGHHVAK